MLAEESLREGKVRDALSQLQEAVRADPSSVRHRVFLFQLLAVLGQWERAQTQLNVAGELDSANLAMVYAYRDSILCESFRAAVFAGERSPLIFGEPEPWIAHLLEALRLSTAGNHEGAAGLRAEAFEAAPTTAGKVDDREIEWIADADLRLGPVLEAVVHGKYYWIPFHRIHRIQFEEPSDLRDYVWAPVHFTWSNGGQTVGMIPSRYPGSEASEDGMVALGRKTVWEEPAPDFYTGLGQRIIATDFDDFALLDLRDVVLDTLEEGATVHED